MPPNELRKDYLLNRWVVIATERARRPTDLAKNRTQNIQTTPCPLCVGNENMTPPAVLLYLKEVDKIKPTQDPSVGERPKNWLIRTIPNLYPAFTPPKQAGYVEQIFSSKKHGDAIGHHEVIVESPNHDETPANAKLTQFELVINAYVSRYRVLSTKPYVKYVSIFRNFGMEAGASLSHVHSQIIAMPLIPATIQEEQVAVKTHRKVRGTCIYCDIIEQERNGPRHIFENEAFLVFTPYASINPLEFWILPKKHAANIENLTRTETKAFAAALKISLNALKSVVNDPPYNYGIHQSIRDNSYHWHLEVYPKLTTWAGFEKSTGVYINTVTPETAAESLRKAINSTA